MLHSRRRTALTNESVADIRTRMTANPKKSIRKLSSETGLSVGSCHFALRKKLKWYPYHIHAINKLIRIDARRIRHCEWFN